MGNRHPVYPGHGGGWAHPRSRGSTAPWCEAHLSTAAAARNASKAEHEARTIEANGPERIRLRSSTRKPRMAPSCTCHGPSFCIAGITYLRRQLVRCGVEHQTVCASTLSVTTAPARDRRPAEWLLTLRVRSIGLVARPIESPGV